MMSEVDMTDFNWCHGPRCHKRETTTRVRGVKGHKVLRTRKIQANRDWDNPYKYWDYFCDQTCLFAYIRANTRELVAIAPRTTPLETPIDVVVETKTDWHGNPYKTKEINVVDNA